MEPDKATQTYLAYEKVSDMASFYEFVRALIADSEDSEQQEKANPTNDCGPAANGWENTSISAFLGAALAREEASNEDDNGEPSWQAFAGFLLGGKDYE